MPRCGQQVVRNRLRRARQQVQQIPRVRRPGRRCAPGPRCAPSSAARRPGGRASRTTKKAFPPVTRCSQSGSTARSPHQGGHRVPRSAAAALSDVAAGLRATSPSSCRTGPSIADLVVARRCRITSDGLSPQPAQHEAQQVHGALVGPVQVVDHQDRRASPAGRRTPRRTCRRDVRRPRATRARRARQSRATGRRSAPAAAACSTDRRRPTAPGRRRADRQEGLDERRLARAGLTQTPAPGRRARAAASSARVVEHR